MIYIHIPFCKQKCSYCNFHFSTSLKFKDEMIAAMQKEIYLRKDELQNKNLKSLYFGGGTPSILNSDEIKILIDEILKNFSFQNDIEITLEANPEDLDKQFLKDLSSTPINRLSIGIQSFFDEDLVMMNRAHNASQAESSVKRAQDLGFENLSIDLIYGSPTSDYEVWKNNLNKTLELSVPHISSYALTVEPKTALNSWIKQQKIQSPKESEQHKDFHYLSGFLKNEGYEHYEISNFAKPGFQSKHNSAYWKHQEYLGIGPSAHSYNGKDVRSWNIANNNLYIKSLANNKIPNDTEVLSEKNRYNEMMMIGLRTILGVNLLDLQTAFNPEILIHHNKEIQKKIDLDLLKIENNHLIIPQKKWFMADGIISDLFII